MIQEIFRRMDRLVRLSIPFFTTAVLVFIGAVNWPLPGFSVIAPMLPLAAVYYWAIYRPDLLPPVWVFTAGLFLDVLAGGLVGVNSLLLLLVYWITASQRRFFLSKPFPVVWWGFVLVTAGVSLSSWVVYSFLSGATVGARPVLFQLVVTLALYPCLTWVFARIQRSLPGTA